MLAATLLIAHGVAVVLIVMVDLPLWLELTAVAVLVVNFGTGGVAQSIAA
jgi:hypothetical protein